MRIRSVASTALLSACLALTLSGCGGSAQSDSNQQQSGENTATESQSTDQGQEAEAEPEPETVVTADNIEKLLKKQDFYCKGFKIYNDYDQYSTMKSGCIHCGTVYNNSDFPVNELTIIAYGYDDEGWPVSWSILGQPLDRTQLSLRIDNAKLKPGKTYSESVFWSDNGVTTTAKKIRTIVAYATALDGEVWENPLLDDWQSIYGGGMLPE